MLDLFSRVSQFSCRNGVEVLVVAYHNVCEFRIFPYNFSFFNNNNNK